MQRISVVGSSGSGKSTMAKVIEQRLGVPRLELDSVYHLPNWEPLANDEFQRRATDFVARDAWVVDGNYTSHGIVDIVWSRADTVVWIDVSRSRVMQQVTWRSLSRAVKREELWNGNTESVLRLTKWDPEENIIRWAWTRHAGTRAKYRARLDDPAWGHLSVVHLRTRREVDRFVASL